MQQFVAAFFLFIVLKPNDSIGVLGFHSPQSSSVLLTTTTTTTRPPNQQIDANNKHKHHVHDSPFRGRYSDEERVLYQYRGGDDIPSDIDLFQKLVLLLNASSKWMLASANLYGVIRYRDPGAFLCIGCILACFGTEHFLKPLWNQARPHSAPIADPGMPSSHSLGSFFMAIGWAHLLRDLEGNDPLLLFLSAASSIASLRIICGYHTMAQVVVGALFGLVLGHGWIDWIWNRLGVKTFLYTHATVRWIIWFTYITGSILFIWKIMYKWIDRRMMLH